MDCMSGGTVIRVLKEGLRRRIGLCVALGACCALQMARAFGEERPPSAEPPPGAVRLFDGHSAPGFVSTQGGAIDWPIEDGALVSTPNGKRSNNLMSRLHFRDAQVHLEFLLPMEGEANSGVYFQGLYEIQILASDKDTQLGVGDMGAIYGLHAPRVNAARGRREWQTLDVRYRTPRRDASGKITEDGTITAWLNGRLIHDRAPIGEQTSDYNPYRYDTTPYVAAIAERQQRTLTGPLMLQDHDSQVRFRNVWILPLDEQGGFYDPTSAELRPLAKE